MKALSMTMTRPRFKPDLSRKQAKNAKAASIRSAGMHKSGRIHFIPRRLIFVSAQCGTCCGSHSSSAQNFDVSPRFLDNL